MVDRIVSWFKSLPGRFINWWEKFTARQKKAIIAIAIVLIASFAFLIYLVSRPTYVNIYSAETAKESQEVIDLLSGNDIAYKLSEDGLIIKINRKDYTAATLLLGSNDIYADSFSIDNVTSGGFSTTEADKQRRHVVYLEKMMETSLRSYSFVKNAIVTLNIPEDDGTLIAKNTEKSASVILTLKGECTSEMASGIARFIATGLGNDSTKNIVIIDSDGRMLFSGSDEESTYGTASSQYALKEQVTNIVKNDVKQMLIASGEFSNVEIAANIVLDNSYTEEAEHLYWPDEGKDQGVLASKDIYQSNTTGGVGGNPGTDSNTETTYQYETGEYSSAQVIEESYDYVPNEKTTMKQIPAGAIKYSESSISITALTYNIIREEDVKAQGLLDGISWSEYKLNNSAKTKAVVEEELYDAISNATGISRSNISVIHYIEPFFVDKEGINLDSSDILQFILIALILGLLLFVIIRSMKAVPVEQEEQEISIEEILKSNPPEELEEIGVEDKSEARKIVEKFVEDNPEAAANLLRNWLAEDWD
ncbi:MAG: flagellar M-ring protein FliF [Lachnospiraceae bacterium]|nr:flagellar M-ring protein FliF [Lachnospiraceae bacterium]